MIRAWSAGLMRIFGFRLRRVGTPRYQLGFRFLALPPGAESALQRLVTRLEMKSRSLVG